MSEAIHRLLLEALHSGEACALVTVANVTGSAPRETGTKMVIFEDGRIVGTIGGGKFESLVVEESQKAIAQASRLSQSVDRWLTQPVPKLERLATSTAFRSRDEIWTQQRLVRRARSQDLPVWLELIQMDIDSYLLGDALRELDLLLVVFPESSEALSLLDEVRRQQNLR